jgi:hypothetical protein
MRVLLINRHMPPGGHKSEVEGLWVGIWESGEPSQGKAQRSNSCYLCGVCGGWASLGGARENGLRVGGEGKPSLDYAMEQHPCRRGSRIILGADGVSPVYRYTGWGRAKGRVGC